MRATLAASFDRPALVVVSEVAVLAKAFRVVGHCLVGAFPGLLGATETVIAVDAHALCIVGLVRVGAACDCALLVDLFRVVKAVYIVAIPL